MLKRLCARQEWQFASVLPRADAWLASLWWGLLVGRGVLPALFAIAMGLLVGAVQAEGNLAPPLALVGGVFVLLQVLAPLHQAVGANLGFRTAAWLYDQLALACTTPPGMAHLEDPELTSDITTIARDFDLGISGPPRGTARRRRLRTGAGGLSWPLDGAAHRPRRRRACPGRWRAKVPSRRAAVPPTGCRRG